ncbi:crossover junction endodeoxyribonuclease RuvC [Candidatus Roizmanbacteria bacterium RIFCSPLOWO2_01_FULL_45_11]|uniref:Crossover junction endodeoxyribonuclease RuvC n=1 Tax=Candidatus Roizmanbacteria bacterium RIFCSPLOWO2_01_FULL_45_11 TaxID=1802070 RepID=A0A1F7JDQ2_9BACT|nr:MAG: crossover junction endodeoxyribonuclease RuvC [Candidatus Roizmanbacteria bacterium RIFCSPLOWO2_01_FULL_45_11]
MIILGIDPGIGRTGWGCINRQSASTTVAVSYGCIETKSTDDEVSRLVLLYREISNVILEYKPETVAAERLFFSTNQKTALTVGQARGVLLLAAGQQGLPVTSYTPLQVKLAITGYGQATKQQIQRMVQSMLGLSTIPQPDDTADALAIALTHCYTANYQHL